MSRYGSGRPGDDRRGAPVPAGLAGHRCWSWAGWWWPWWWPRSRLAAWATWVSARAAVCTWPRSSVWWASWWPGGSRATRSAGCCSARWASWSSAATRAPTRWPTTGCGTAGLPLGWVAVLLQPSWAPAIALFGLSVLLFPDGRLSGPPLALAAVDLPGRRHRVDRRHRGHLGRGHHRPRHPPGCRWGPAGPQPSGRGIGLVGLGPERVLPGARGVPGWPRWPARP